MYFFLVLVFNVTDFHSYYGCAEESLTSGKGVCLVA